MSEHRTRPALLAIPIVCALVLAFALVSGCGSSTDTATDTTSDAGSAAQEQTTDGSDDATDDTATDDAAVDTTLIATPLDNGYGEGIHHATITVKDYGTITVELDADVAPITVSNFAQLANDGFYDGLTFHRVIEGFMIQGGDPNGDGSGGSDRPIIGEFESNGTDNTIKHERGTISMARASDPNSASSQFFIMQEDASYLDGEYAAFGRVTEGMDVVDAIVDDVARYGDSNGVLASDKQPVIESVTMVD